MSTKNRALLLVFSTAVISGVSIFANGLLAKNMMPSTFTFLKNATVATFLFAIVLHLQSTCKFKNMKPKHWLQLMLIGLIGGSIPFLLFFKGLSMTTGTMAAFVHKTMFIFIALFASRFLGEKLHPLWFLGALFLLIGNGLFLNVDILSFNFAHLLILAATIFWAAENTLSKYVLRELPGTVVAWGRMFFGSLFLLIFLAFTGQLTELGQVFTSQNLLAVGVTSLFLMGYVLTWYNGIKKIPVSIAACILLMGSPITTLLSAGFLDKALTIHQFGGIAVLAEGVLIILLSFHYSSRSPALSTP